jgi:VanZ family protein
MVLPADKAAHFVEYAVLGFLLFRAIFSAGRVPMKWAALLVILCTAALGALDEFYQNLTGRDSDIFDWIVDCLGATIALLCCLVFYTRIQENVRAKKARKSHS